MKRRGCLLLSVIFLGCVGLLAECGDYRFGVRERYYPELFGPGSGGLNRVLKLNGEYSWHTRVSLGSDRLTIEHGVLASQADVQRVGLPHGDYLFFSIEGAVPQVRSIQARHTYEGVELDVAGTFVFQGSKLIGGKCSWNGGAWEVTPYDGGELKEDCEFGYVRLYKLPESTRFPVSPHNPFLFPGKLHEQIVVSTESAGLTESHEFELVAQWHKATSFWWRFLNLT